MKTKSRVTKIEITHRTIFFIVAVIASIWLFTAVKDIIIALFVAMLVTAATHPSVKALEKRGVPKPLSAALILLSSFVILISIFASLAPLVIGQVNLLLTRLPMLIERFPYFQFNFSDIASQIAPLSGNLVKIALDTFSATVFISTIFVITFYLILERDNMDKYIGYFFEDKQNIAEKVINQIEYKLGHWVRGQAMLMVIVGFLTYLGLLVIGLEYAIPLAIIAGLLELVPNLGPTISSIPAILVGFAISPLHGILTIVLYVLVQQLENNLIVPQVMSKTIGIHPVVTIIALLLGFRLGGALLAVLALPIVLVAQVIITELNAQKQLSKETLH